MNFPFRHSLHLLVGGLCIALTMLIAFAHQGRRCQVSWDFLFNEPPPAQTGRPLYLQSFVSGGSTRLVHAASAIQRPDGVIQAFWFGGSREGHPDVNIFTATYDASSNSWNEEVVVVSRQATQAAEHRLVKKLGNPVAAVDRDGRIWLFFVSVSVGGWSGSSINLTVSEDQGRTWSPPRQLATSPFFNISTLVKGPPVLYADGSMGVPAYHEFLGKFSEVLRLAPDGRVVGKTRMTCGRLAIQPVLFPLDARNALALMRNTDGAFPRRAWSSRTHDGGKTWTEPARTDILNKDSAIGGLVAHDKIISVVNFSERHRNGLSLFLSRDQGRTWSFVHDVEPPRPPLAPEPFRRATAMSQGSTRLSQDDIARLAAATQCTAGRAQCNFRFDYPYLIQDRAGTFHLFYTWNRALIRHVAFNSAWLDQQPNQPLDVLMRRESK
jgi:predicted neuraminidase